MLVTIRRATAEDIPALYGLNRAFNGPGATTEEAMALALGQNDGEIVLLACREGEAAGFCCGRIYRSLCYGDLHGEITELYVEKAFRRQGVAGALMEEMERIFRTEGVRVATLVTRLLNTGAQRFYRSRGYLGDMKLIYRKELDPL